MKALENDDWAHSLPLPQAKEKGVDSLGPAACMCIQEENTPALCGLFLGEKENGRPAHSNRPIPMAGRFLADALKYAGWKLANDHSPIGNR
jgi:hypothetical protein